MTKLVAISSSTSRPLQVRVLFCVVCSGFEVQRGEYANAQVWGIFQVGRCGCTMAAQRVEFRMIVLLVVLILRRLANCAAAAYSVAFLDAGSETLKL